MTVASTSCLSCASCHAVFENADVHRTHYQSDWHRYNLRRKVVELPPVTETIFQQRLQTAESGQTVKMESVKMDCAACKKSFASRNSFENHLRSRKHHEATAFYTLTKQTNPPKMEVKDVKVDDVYLDEEATEEQIKEAIEAKLKMARRLKPEECIFCNQHFDSFEVNMEHMTTDHGLYIPDLDYVEDLPGLVAYLADKVSVAFCCLYCSAAVQPFTSMESVRRHMQDKGHLKIRFDDEGIQELADFYDYEIVLSDDGDEEFMDIDSDDGEYHSNGESEALIISPDETELILPSGRRLGHRAYRRYYKQNIRVEETPRQSRRGEHQALISRMSDHYLAMGLAQPAAERRYVSDQRRGIDRQKDWEQKLGVKANGLQEHFRYQLRQ